MKKIFGLFAMAALAATGLTCCGGGGGNSGSIEYKTLYLSAPGDESADGKVVPGSAGSMWIRLEGDNGTGQIPAKFAFGGVGKTGHDATVMQYETDDKNTVTFTFNVYSSDNLQGDQDALSFFQKAMDELEVDDEGEVEGVVEFPAMLITLTYNSDKAGGTYKAEFPGVKVKVDNTPDNPDDDDFSEEPAPPAYGIFSEVF